MTATQETPPKPTPTLTIAWEPLPDDFQLDEEPVDNINQPLLAGALSEALELAGYIKPPMMVAGNLGICATVNGDLVIKAPDWFYTARVQDLPPRSDRRSYTPHLEGDVPSLVMEFLSHKEGGEYSVKRTYPPGKWFFYEQILKIPTYIVFEPDGGLLEVYRLHGERYELEMPDPQGRHWIEAMGLYLGTWQGEKEGRMGYWLRWWDEAENLLLWGVELLESERQRAETERQRAESERQRAEKLAAYLREQGINPDELLS